jgi:hypothetical protein
MVRLWRGSCHGEFVYHEYLPKHGAWSQHCKAVSLSRKMRFSFDSKVSKRKQYLEGVAHSALKRTYHRHQQSLRQLSQTSVIFPTHKATPLLRTHRHASGECLGDCQCSWLISRVLDVKNAKERCRYGSLSLKVLVPMHGLSNVRNVLSARPM